MDDQDPPPHRAAPAANWRTVLLADATLGAAIVAFGVYLAFTWIPFLGAGLASLGLVYVLLVARRGTQWAAWRRRNGLAR